MTFRSPVDSFVVELATKLIDHPIEAAWFIISVESVCLSLRLSDDNYRKPRHGKFIFAHPVYLPRIRVRFVYEGHRVKVKVTGAKMVENSYSRNVNFGRP